MTFREIDRSSLECFCCTDCTAPTCGDGSNGGPSIFGATQVAKGPHQGPFSAYTGRRRVRAGHWEEAFQRLQPLPNAQHASSAGAGGGAARARRGGGRAGQRRRPPPTVGLVIPGAHWLLAYTAHTGCLAYTAYAGCLALKTISVCARARCSPQEQLVHRRLVRPARLRPQRFATRAPRRLQRGGGQGSRHSHAGQRHARRRLSLHQPREHGTHRSHIAGLSLFSPLPRFVRRTTAGSRSSARQLARCSGTRHAFRPACPPSLSGYTRAASCSVSTPRRET